MKKDSFLFSIIVPVYNTEKYVKDSLESIRNAMDEDCEVIIVNDGSTDNSEKIILDFINSLPENYKDNFVYTKKENKGLADTKNVGIEMSRGEFISVVDSDDTISDDFYTIARKYINDYDIIIYDLYIAFEKNKLYNYTSRAKREDRNDDLIAYLNGAMSGSSCNKIIKKSLYKDYKFLVGRQYEDVSVTPFILTDCEKIKYIPYPLYNYLQREKSIVASNTLMSAFYKICDNITEVLRNRSFEKYKYVINEFYTNRILDIFVQDFNENKNEFLNNIEKFAKGNADIIKFIYESDMIYNLENDYSSQQKDQVKLIFKYLVEGDYNKIKKFFAKRKTRGYFANIKGCLKNLIKAVLNK